MKFPIRTEGYAYRPLKVNCTPGWDCWALQAALVGKHFNIAIDGYFGPRTAAAVESFQRDIFFSSADYDGIAGAKTQRALVLSLLPEAQSDFQLPKDLLKGHVEAESSFLVGNHSPGYPDHTADLGLTMLHRTISDSTCQEAFNVPVCLYNMAKFLREHKDEFYGYLKARSIDSNEQAWKLAVGAWNAPAWARTLAKGGTLSGSQNDWFNNYVNRATVYATRLNVG